MLSPNTLLQNRYRIIRQLGQGGMGTVYEATDERFDNPVALKQAHFDTEALRKQFEREARLLNRLRHPAMTKVIDHFTDGNGQFLVMEYISGDNLWEMLYKRNEPFPVDDVLNWADQLLDALEYLHSQTPPIVHRDIKPENLKIGARGQIILLDFGLAKGFAGQMSRVTPSGSIFGFTPNYAPLEQIQGTGTDPRSDLYSLGATIYHLLTNVVPVDALSRASAIVSELPDPLQPANEINREVTAEIADILWHAMAQNPGKRPSSAAEMRASLREAERSLKASSSEGNTLRLPPDKTPTHLPPTQNAQAFTPTLPSPTERAPEVVPPPTIASDASSQKAQEPVLSTPTSPIQPTLRVTYPSVLHAGAINSGALTDSKPAQILEPTRHTASRNMLIAAGMAVAILAAILAVIYFSGQTASNEQAQSVTGGTNSHSVQGIGDPSERNTVLRDSNEDELSSAAPPSPVPNPRTAEEFLSRGSYLASQRNFDAAISDYRQAIALESNNPLAHNRLGMALLMKNQFAEAMQEFRTAIEQRGGNYPNAQFNLGYALQRRAMRDNNDELYNEAVSAFVSAINQRNGNYPDAYYQIGLIRLNQRRDAEAMDALRRAIQQNNRDPEAHYYLGISLLRQRYFDEAEAAFRSTIEQHGRRTADAHLMLGGLYEETNRPADAIREYEAYLQQPNAQNRRDVEVRLRGLRSQSGQRSTNR
jgi:serine/threonine protein kinase/Tfp pilus assembly protein PilF